MNNTEQVLLDVRGLSIDIINEAGPQRVVHNLDFRLERGRTLGIVGESGSGKSMTASAIMGILPDVAVADGEVFYKGNDLLQVTPAQRRKLSGPELGFIFQEPMSALHPTMSIGEQMVRPMRLHLGLSKSEAQSRAQELLDLVGIPAQRGVMGSYVHQLSGGMRQRVMIAMSISCEPALLLADEPTTALDATIQKQILDLLMRLRDDLGLSLILISHDLGLVAKYTDDVVVLLDGYEMEAGTTADVIACPRSGYTRGLLEAAPRLGQRLDRLPVINKSEFTKAVAK
ncbi:ABC transporter ATP-binding protein [Pseudarthrobacter sulfonivorans]|uniref:ABC transporter ATP-binding protein n=1 Tax=Pseudarthrobacter sulfonivorans TaxID=121292 RepID=UPI00285A4C04|nr:ABC transporter ATP-binding protein [Pseudarthrobacter sulfonivorans]MDR6414867.1 ABC-type glutathione transport system ATPase component [Pseudarthrobacter sulfonivorans]